MLVYLTQQNPELPLNGISVWCIANQEEVPALAKIANFQWRLHNALEVLARDIALRATKEQLDHGDQVRRSEGQLGRPQLLPFRTIVVARSALFDGDVQVAKSGDVGVLIHSCDPVNWRLSIIDGQINHTYYWARTDRRLGVPNSRVCVVPVVGNVTEAL